MRVWKASFDFQFDTKLNCDNLSNELIIEIDALDMYI